MSFPDIHSCTQFAAENVELKRRLHRLKQQYEETVRELRELKDKKKTEDLLKNFVTTRDTYVQTETRTWSTTSHRQTHTPHTSNTSKVDTEKTNKLLSMHSSLLRRYEKEVKHNMDHVETIANLNIRVSEVEVKLKEEREKCVRLEADIVGLKCSASTTLRDGELREVQREKAKLKKENKKLRAELDGLDENFFDEIEDIKFAFQQSAKLNKEYEKALRKLCHKFAVPYPHPEQALLKT